LRRGAALAAGVTIASSGFGAVAVAQEVPPRANLSKPLKLIMRVDDVGYTDVNAIGTFRAIDTDIVTHVDVMFDTPGSLGALQRLKKYPWLSIGWHNHSWGSPVLGAAKAPSLVDANGRFKFSVRDGTALVGDGAKIRDEARKLEDDVKYEEIVAEFRAQMELCKKIVGRPPDTGGGKPPTTLVAKAENQVATEYGLKSGWFTSGAGQMVLNGAVYNLPFSPAKPEYANLHIYKPNQFAGTTKYMFDPPAPYAPERYNPMNGMREDGDHILDKEIAMIVFHPGFVDDYIATDGGIQFTMNRIRVLDAHFLVSDELRQWLKKNRVQLISVRDALNGTNEFQTHLRRVGSDLYVA
jgi:predicted glycoside hydrolase/deacetylase ChbG (UPF0249 family)